MYFAHEKDMTLGEPGVECDGLSVSSQNSYVEV